MLVHAEVEFKALSKEQIPVDIVIVECEGNVKEQSLTAEQLTIA